MHYNNTNQTKKQNILNKNDNENILFRLFMSWKTNETTM